MYMYTKFVDQFISMNSFFLYFRCFSLICPSCMLALCPTVEPNTPTTRSFSRQNNSRDSSRRLMQNEFGYVKHNGDVHKQGNDTGNVNVGRADVEVHHCDTDVSFTTGSNETPSPVLRNTIPVDEPTKSNCKLIQLELRPL